MGGGGSGARSRHYTAEECLRVSVEDVARASVDALAGAEQDPGEPTAVLRYRSAIGNGVVIERSESVRLVWTRPPYGGRRWWFCCPRCRRRCGVLYSAPLYPTFACRLCHDLRYVSQRADDSRRLLLRARQIVRRCGGDLSGEALALGRAILFKPRGMHQRTFSRLLLHYRAVIDRRDRAFVAQYGPQFGIRP